MKERCLTEGQKGALGFLAQVLREENSGNSQIVVNKQPLAEAFNLSPRELGQVGAIIGLVGHYVSRKTGGEGIDPRLKRRFAAALVNNSPGSKQMQEEKEGKIHTPRGHFPTGRNHGGRVKSRR